MLVFLAFVCAVVYWLLWSSKIGFAITLLLNRLRLNYRLGRLCSRPRLHAEEFPCLVIGVALIATRGDQLNFFHSFPIIDNSFYIPLPDDLTFVCHLGEFTASMRTWILLTRFQQG